MKAIFTVGFAKDGVHRLAEIAFQLNERTENIGARRLHAVMERLLEDISFDASDQSSGKVKIDKKYVDKYLDKLAQNKDLSKYIL